MARPSLTKALRRAVLATPLLVTLGCPPPAPASSGPKPPSDPAHSPSDAGPPPSPPPAPPAPPPPEMLCPPEVPCGRNPPHLLPAAPSRARSPLGRHLATMARLERAAVAAFRVLARELAAHGAPARLVAAARRAARDEVRHARVTAALARRHGATPLRPRLGAPPVARSLEAIALENAVEGCVRETYGAAVALWQSRHAEDQRLAAAMTAIARDELRHAELAWSVDHWASTRLAAAARRRVADAKRAALDALANDVRADVAEPLVARAGLPNAPTAAALLANVATVLPRSGAL